MVEKSRKIITTSGWQAKSLNWVEAKLGAASDRRSIKRPEL
jgi:hypothetical protein